MAGLPITSLTAVSAAALTDLHAVVQGTDTLKETNLQIRTLFGFDASTGILTAAAGGAGSNLSVTTSFTPVLEGSVDDPTSITYSNQIGKCIKVGNIVFYKARITLSALTIGTASGDLLITGLPFTSVTDSASTPGSCYLQNTAFTGIPASFIGSNSANISLITSATGTTATVIPITAITSTSDIVVSGMIFTA